MSRAEGAAALDAKSNHILLAHCDLSYILKIGSERLASSWCDDLPEYEVVAECDGRRVVMLGKLRKEYKRVERKDAAAVLRWMQIWCRDEVDALPPERFKQQERYVGATGSVVKISAFKSYQARFYGFSRSVQGKETFFVTALDPAKKSDQADPQMLKRASDEAFRILAALKIK